MFKNIYFVFNAINLSSSRRIPYECSNHKWIVIAKNLEVRTLVHILCIMMVTGHSSINLRIFAVSPPLEEYLRVLKSIWGEWKAKKGKQTEEQKKKNYSITHSSFIIYNIVNCNSLLHDMDIHPS